MLFLGILFWVVLGLVTVLTGGLVRMVRGKNRLGPKVGSSQRPVPPGYISFVVLGGLVGAALAVAGVMLSNASFLTSFGGWLGMGLVYGVGLWSAAHNGYLPFPDDD